MKAKKQVRSRLFFKKGAYPLEDLDVTATYNMTKRDYMDRNPDMEVETEDGLRMIISKDIIVAVTEIRVVKQVVEEVKDEKRGIVH
jgi:hypothetical protein